MRKKAEEELESFKAILKKHGGTLDLLGRLGRLPPKLICTQKLVLAAF